MLVSIGSYAICDGSRTGAGVAVSQLRLKADRLFEFVVPVGDIDSVLLDRITTTCDFTFTVARTHSSAFDAELFIIQLDQNIPTSGNVIFTATGPTSFTRQIPFGFLVDHSLVDEHGATTFHQYHIIGGPPVA